MGFKASENLSSAGYKNKHKQKRSMGTAINSHNKLYRQYKRMYNNLTANHSSYHDLHTIHSIMGRTSLTGRVTTSENRELALLEIDKHLSCSLGTLKLTDIRFAVMRLVISNALERRLQGSERQLENSVFLPNQYLGDDTLETTIERRQRRNRMERLELERIERLQFFTRRRRLERLETIAGANPPNIFQRQPRQTQEQTNIFRRNRRIEDYLTDRLQTDGGRRNIFAHDGDDNNIFQRFNRRLREEGGRNNIFARTTRNREQIDSPRNIFANMRINREEQERPRINIFANPRRNRDETERTRDNIFANIFLLHDGRVQLPVVAETVQNQDQVQNVDLPIAVVATEPENNDSERTFELIVSDSSEEESGEEVNP